MSTLTETLSSLYALQQVDSQIQRAKRAQAALDNGAAATEAAQAAQGEAQRRRTAWQQAAGDLKDSELKLEGVETKRRNYQQKLYQGTVTNPKELANIEREIEALGRQRSDLDGRILELMEQVEQDQAALAAAEAAARQADGHRADVRAAYRSRYDALDLELSALAERRRAAAALVDDQALLKRYDDIRAKAGGVGIARIEGGACGGCHMTLPAGTVKAVKEGAQAQTCENCGRLLTA
jgi:predicted  nucleic acid-binding Zn-ribbon protein